MLKCILKAFHRTDLMNFTLNHWFWLDFDNKNKMYLTLNWILDTLYLDICMWHEDVRSISMELHLLHSYTPSPSPTLLEEIFFSLIIHLDCCLSFIILKYTWKVFKNLCSWKFNLLFIYPWNNNNKTMYIRKADRRIPPMPRIELNS